MRKIILSKDNDEIVRATVLTALVEIEEKEKEVKDREKEVKDREKDVLLAKLDVETLKGIVQTNELELKNVLNANSLLTPRGVIGP